MFVDFRLNIRDGVIHLILVIPGRSDCFRPTGRFPICFADVPLFLGIRDYLLERTDRQQRGH